jgi:hypothetical protein
MSKEARIILNRIKCNHCGDIIISYYTHDYKNCNCGTVSVDGGVEYLKRGFINDNDYEELSLYDTEPFSVIRENLHWGTYGKDAKDPLHFITIESMEENHIKAILRNNHGSEWMKSFLIKELKYRRENNL